MIHTIIVMAAMLMPHQNSNKRILTIYTKSVDNAYYKQQVKLLTEDKPGLDDRNIVIETYVYSSKTSAKFKSSRIKSEFAVTLTGKDGGEKYRDTQPVTLQKLYGIIDAMPMRKAEMRQQ